MAGRIQCLLFMQYAKLSLMSRKRKILFVLICFAIAASAAAGGIYWHLRSPQKGPVKAIRDFDSLMHRMDTLAATSDAITLNTPGTVTYEGVTWPLLMISRSANKDPRLSVLLTGCIHGNEPAGAEFLLRFAETLAKENSLYPDINFDIIPVVNPWGWVHGRRRNGEDRDLNREFATFKAQESLIMRDLCKRKQYTLMVDFHEDSHVGGFYLYRLANPDEALCRNMITRVREAGLPIHNGRVMTLFNAENGIITSPLWTLRLARCIHQLSMSNYFRLEGCPQAFLFETPRQLKLGSRVSMDQAALSVLLGNGPENRPGQ